MHIYNSNNICISVAPYHHCGCNSRRKQSIICMSNRQSKQHTW